jgi:hypothetical protein
LWLTNDHLLDGSMMGFRMRPADGEREADVLCWAKNVGEKTARTAHDAKHFYSAMIAALVALPDLIAKNRSQYEMEMIGRLTFELEKRKEATCQKT